MIRSIVNFGGSIFRTMPKSESTFYAVKRGRIPGVYSTWSDCEKQVKAFSNPIYRKFASHTAALEFLTENATYSAQSSSQQYSTDASQIVKVPPVANICSMDAAQNVKASSATGTCCQCGHGALSNVSLNSAVEEMKASMGNILHTVEMLNVGLAEVRSTVSRLENSLFIGVGSKRSFCTSTNDEHQAKRPKFDATISHFTGRRFSDNEGVHVYTDGGCFDNGRSGARAGLGVYWAKNDPDNVSERLPGRPTNNRAEIHAAVRAVQIAKKKGIGNLVLHTDSQFLINGITKWIRGWKKNQWKKTTGSPVINQDDFEELDRELKGINVKWVYVRGHSGDPSNEEADLLAKQGAQKLE